MVNFNPSELTITYDKAVFGNINDNVDDYIKDESLNIKATGNTEYEFEIKKIRLASIEHKGEEVLAPTFDEIGNYKQRIYVVIDGISDFNADRVTINGKPALPEEVIMLDENVVVLTREISILEPGDKIETEKAVENFDVLPEELAEDQNAAWKNEAINPKTLYIRADKPVHIYTSFADESEVDMFEPGQEFVARIKRINVFDKLEYYKVAHQQYVLVTDTVDSDTLEKQQAEMDEKRKEFERQQAEFEAQMMAQQAAAQKESKEDYAEEVEEPFKVIANPDVILMFTDKNGNNIAGKSPEPASVWEVTEIQHQFIDGDDVERYRVNGDEYLLKADVIPYSEEALAEAQKAAKATPNSSNFGPQRVHADTSMLRTLPETTDSELEKIEEDKETEVFDEEAVKADAFAVKNAFDIDETAEEVNGIVSIKGEDEEVFDLYDSFKISRRKLDEQVHGGTYWYTDTLGTDEHGDKFYQIAKNQWINAENTQFFKNN